MEIIEKAYAKLNISLDVIGKRADGYHDMCMVMQTISLHDRVAIRAAEGSGMVFLKTNRDYLPSDQRNHAVKAAVLFMEHCEIHNKDITIDLDKKIPVCAGMAGGSADAAAVLRGLNQLFSADLSQKELMDIGCKIGADVPYCVLGGTALAEGIGEILTPLPPMPNCWFVVCKPPFPISTPALFQLLDQKKVKFHPDTNGMLSAINEGNLTEICRRVYNVFEDVAFSGLSMVQAIKTELTDLNAVCSAMTGTGSAVFGIFTSSAAAEKAKNVLSKKYHDTFLCTPVQ